MAGAQGDPGKWLMPGWRIEQRFSNGTLIGNWVEERQLFKSGTHRNTSTHRSDFRTYPDSKPDKFSRRSALIRNEGLPAEQMFAHHGKKYQNASNLISWYDEQYNRRVRDPKDKLPDLRSWDGHRLAWAPEKTDFPMTGQPTNFGLLPLKEDQWKNQMSGLRMGSYHTNYLHKYVKPPSTAYPYRYASAPKYLSSHFNPITRINKDLWLRRTPCVIAPEHPPNVSPPTMS